MVSTLRNSIILCVALSLYTVIVIDSHAQKRTMTFEDVMTFRNMANLYMDGGIPCGRPHQNPDDVASRRRRISAQVLEC